MSTKPKTQYSKKKYSITFDLKARRKKEKKN